MKLPRNAWLALGLVGTVIVGASTLVAPPARALDALAEEAETLRSRIARSDDGASQLVRLTEQLAELEEMVQHRTKPIPAESDVAGLIRKLSAELTRLGLNEREITTGATVTTDDASSLPMSVQLHGDFTSMYESVRWVESLPRLVRVQRVQIRQNDRARTSDRPVRADVVLDVFFAPAQAEDKTTVSAAGAGGAR